MFDLDRFVADCRAATAADRSHRAVREVVARAVAEPGAVLRGLGEPQRAGLTRLHHSPELTILNVVWGPMMTIMPHNHRMWAVIGIYSGREDNIFWRRVGEEEGRSRVEATGARALSTGDCTALSAEIVHSVTNPIPRLTGAIHVYGGDFFAVERSEWDPETLREQPYDVAKAIRLFEESNGALAAAAAARH
jgi:predicted metal-dependent enzyme (double-stranded beta helix superfamily)